MSDQTPTPRTDETWEDSKAKCLKWSTTAFIMRECSAKLERELAAAIADRDEARAEAAELRERLEVEHKALQVAGAVIERLESEGDQLRERVERLRRALEYYAGAPWVAHHGPWHNANFADVADRALAETEPKGEA